MNYKAKLRIPTEQYAYVEVEVEGDPEDIVNAHDEFTRLLTPQTGLDSKEFNKALDRYLTKGEGETETYLRMNRDQKLVIQEIKKSFKRINKA